MTINIPLGSDTAGIPGYGTETVVPAPVLMTGDSPTPISETETVAFSQTILARMVVGKVTTGGKIVKSVQNANDGSQNPIGYAVFAVTTDADDVKTVEVVKAGTYNPDALVWDASWDTEAKKAIAFKAAAPMFFLKRPTTGS